MDARRARATEIREVRPDHPDALRLLEAYFSELRVRIRSYAAPSLDELRADGERGITLVCYEDEVAVGCGALRALDPTTAEVKRMFVALEARGRGHAGRILRALEAKAQSFRFARVVLDTAAPLHEATTMYGRAGFTEIERYNDNPVAARWFEKAI